MLIVHPPLYKNVYEGRRSVFYCSLLYFEQQAGMVSDHGNCLREPPYRVVAPQHHRLLEPTQKIQGIWSLWL